MRLIDANALNYKNLAEVNGRLTYVLTAEEIDNAPTVEIPVARWDCYCEGQKVGYEKALSERPQGEWIDHSDDYGYAECPFCHELTNCDGPIEELNFCWKCGAKLGKAVNEDDKI